MRHVTRAVLVSMLVFVGIGCEEQNSNTEELFSTTKDDLSLQSATQKHSGTVLASLSLGEEQVLEFVEFKPGVIGTIETGPVYSAPKVTAKLKKMNLNDLYRHFAGKSAKVPVALSTAAARIAAMEQAPVDSMTPPPSSPEVREVNVGDAPHFYNSAEQIWFRDTFCVGAQECVQGWTYANAQSYKSISSGAGYYMAGSEAVNAVANEMSAWYSNSWHVFWRAYTLPGYWRSIGVTAPNQYIWWALSGAGNATASVAATY